VFDRNGMAIKAAGGKARPPLSAGEGEIDAFAADQNQAPVFEFDGVGVDIDFAIW
jgi:hypothetical protein